MTLRVYEGGRFHYRFRCPQCTTFNMVLFGMEIVKEDALDEPRPMPEFRLLCSRCGAKRAVRELPIAAHLGSD